MDFQPTAYIHWLNGRVSINSKSATALRCGSSNLNGRKWLLVQNSATGPIYIGSEFLSSGTFTTITANVLGKWGTKLATGDMMWLPVSEGITIYARSHSGSQVVRIAEGA